MKEGQVKLKMTRIYRISSKLLNIMNQFDVYRHFEHMNSFNNIIGCTIISYAEFIRNLPDFYTIRGLSTDSKMFDTLWDEYRDIILAIPRLMYCNNIRVLTAYYRNENIKEVKFASMGENGYISFKFSSDKQLKSMEVYMK